MKAPRSARPSSPQHTGPGSSLDIMRATRQAVATRRAEVAAGSAGLSGIDCASAREAVARRQGRAPGTALAKVVIDLRCDPVDAPAHRFDRERRAQPLRIRGRLQRRRINTACAQRGAIAAPYFGVVPDEAAVSLRRQRHVGIAVERQRRGLRGSGRRRLQVAVCQSRRPDSPLSCAG